MTVYKANPELEEILLNHGFKDVTPIHDIKKGKKHFKTSNSSRKKLKFDYINIEIFGNELYDSRISLNEKELQSLLTYFKLSKSDLKEVLPNEVFNFTKFEDRIVSIENELNSLREFHISNSRARVLDRIIDTYHSLASNTRPNHHNVG